MVVAWPAPAVQYCTDTALDLQNRGVANYCSQWYGIAQYRTNGHKATNRENSTMSTEKKSGTSAFQADGAGSIPVARSTQKQGPTSAQSKTRRTPLIETVAKSVANASATGSAAAALADELAKARADLAKATVAAKLATAKKARLAATVRALEAESELVRLREELDEQRARARAAEAALAAERAEHLAEEREHAAEVEQLNQPKRQPARKPANGREPATAPATLVAVRSAAGPDSAEPDEPISDRRATRDSAPPLRE